MCLISACKMGLEIVDLYYKHCVIFWQITCLIPVSPFPPPPCPVWHAERRWMDPKCFLLRLCQGRLGNWVEKKECTFILDATLLAISKTKNTTKTTNNGPQPQLLQVWRSIWADKNEGNFQFQKHTDIKKSLEETDVGGRGLLFINPPLPMTLQATEFLSSYIVNLLLLHTSSFSLLTWIHVHVES